ERLGLAGNGRGTPPIEAASPEAQVPAGPPVDLPSPLPAGDVDTIPVRTEPPGGRIYLDNQEVLGGTLTLPKDDTGSHTLVAENDCFVDRATVKAGSEEPVVIPLKTPKLDPVRVVSDPAGASIFVDGRSAGARAPADINLELCQPHTIAARLDGYQTATKEFGEKTDWNANSTVTLTLPVLPDGFVSVKAPYEIDVVEGGKVIGKGGGKIKLKAGRHSLRFVNEDLFVNLSASVDVSPDKTSSPGLKFPGVGGMSVHANPSNGQVSVNGRKLGPPPILDYSLAEGTYKVSYVLPSGRSEEQTILVIAGERESVKFILK
ncbi:MAG TPA: PEGA domain-containing protein, partial [Candidatus Saccharimonadales bacterium]|nr:PEGA domain-containing protein [Candidatus Saccharimonadales bacterium]